MRTFDSAFPKHLFGMITEQERFLLNFQLITVDNHLDFLKSSALLVKHMSSYSITSITYCKLRISCSQMKIWKKKNPTVPQGGSIVLKPKEACFILPLILIASSTAFHCNVNSCDYTFWVKKNLETCKNFTSTVFLLQYKFLILCQIVSHLHLIRANYLRDDTVTKPFCLLYTE